MGFCEVQKKAVEIQRAVEESSILIGPRGEACVPGLTCRPGMDMATYAQSLREEADRLSESMFKILFMGTFKNGKSTTINAMLGKPLLPAKATAATAVISQVHYGEHTNQVKIYRNNKAEPEIVSQEQFLEQFQLTEEDSDIIEENGELDRFSDVDYVALENPADIFRDGVQFIDSPGLEEAIARTKTTEQFVPKANAIVFLLDATKLFSDKEKHYVRNHFEMAEPKMRNVFFVVNRFNQLNTDEDRRLVMRQTNRQLKGVFSDEAGNVDEELYKKRVFFVNSYQALKDRMEGREPAGTGMPEFQAALEEFLTSNDRVLARYQSVLANMADVYDQVERQIINTEEILKKPLAELEQNAVKAEKQLEQLKNDVKSMQDVIRKTEQLVELKIWNSLENHINIEMPKAWGAHMGTYDKKFGITDMIKVAITKNEAKRKQLLLPMVTFINQFVEDQLNQWGKTVQVLIQPEIDDMQGELRDKAVEFQVKLDEAMALFSGKAKASAGTGGGASKVQLALSLIQGDFSVAVENAAGGNFSWGEYIKKYVVQAVINIVLASVATGGLFTILWLAIEALQIGMKASQTRDNILNGIAGELFPRVSMEVKSQKNQIIENIRGQFEGMGQSACSAVYGMIQDAKQLQDNILSQKSQTEAQSRAEMEREKLILDALYQRISFIYRNLYDRDISAENLKRLAASIRKSE